MGLDKANQYCVNIPAIVSHNNDKTSR